MDKRVFLDILQIAVATVLIISILLQAGGEGFSSPFGQGGESFRTRRGVEKALLYLTLVMGVAFIVITIVGLLI
jgi:protein translocase SecG subunit